MGGRSPVRHPALRVVRDASPEAPVSTTRTTVTRPALPPGMDDAQLLEACRRGDPTAATALYRRVRPIVDVTLARLLGRKDSRFEDLAHVAMIELVRSVTTFRGDCSLDTWASRVTAHAVYKDLRRRKLEHRIFAEPMLDEEPNAHDENPVAEARSVLRRVRGHLAEIDPVKAWTLVLHDVGGYDLKEIAEITGASVAAAQSRLVRGRTDLQARLEADPELADMLEKGGRR